MPNPDIQVAQTQFWSLAVQRSVARNTVVEASYSGAKGTHLYDIENINLAGAGQVYLGDPLVTGPLCDNSGYVNETGVATASPAPTANTPTSTCAAASPAAVTTLLTSSSRPRIFIIAVLP